MGRIFFITGTDTGVGKTLLTVLLTRHLRARGVRVRAVKPFCSGGREDAEALFAAQEGELSLDEINPWHFPAPLTPLLAARHERRQIPLAAVVGFLRASAKGTDVLLVEGAGGLLSPLGDAYSARELIVALRALPLVVCPNRLGAINQARLVVECLPRAVAKRARIVLMEQANPDSSAPGNRQFLTELLGAGAVHGLPWLEAKQQTALTPKLNRLLEPLVA